jgi:hypothetical protein
MLFVCIVTMECNLFVADYLLSNNHVNSIIVHKFDFSDEEVMAYYISFLKTLSLKLNAHTIHFFYNEVRNSFRISKGPCSSIISVFVLEVVFIGLVRAIWNNISFVWDCRFLQQRVVRWEPSGMLHHVIL